jgi:hypothetical protein
MHNAAKLEVKDLSTKVKTASDTVENLDSKFGRQATYIAKIQKEMKTALKGK